MGKLKDKAINIKGKEYILVKDRIIEFNSQCPNGKIETKIVSMDNNRIVVRATVTPDVANPERRFADYSMVEIGSSQINTQSPLENCSTSAVGRALAYMGIGVIDSVASADEMNRIFNPPEPVKTVAKAPKASTAPAQGLECANCDAPISKQEADWGLKFYGKPCCRNCQKILPKNK